MMPVNPKTIIKIVVIGKKVFDIVQRTRGED